MFVIFKTSIWDFASTKRDKEKWLMLEQFCERDGS
jgi:hypothetical protein